MKNQSKAIKTYSISKNRYNALLIDSHIRSNLIPLSKMRYDLLNGPKIIIEDEHFEELPVTDNLDL